MAVLDVVREHPLCAETPAPVLRHAITPPESVYVRSNFDTPMAHDGWSIRLQGAVDRPTVLGLPELAAMPQHAVLVTMECAGNWRLGMDPVPEGEPWKYGAVSTTRWSGVPLARVLELAGVASAAVEVLAIGADAGPRSDAEGIVRFERSLPIEVAMHPDTLLATHMDGAPLTAEHGAPVRLLVPGWYGMASVKWVVGLDVRTEPFTGYFQRQRYVYQTGSGTTPVTRALVKSMIVSPASHAACPRHVEIRGWAWSGSGAIARVEVAVGDRWFDAQLGAAASAYAWTPFVLQTALPTGAVTLRSRATDVTGAVQPEVIEWNALGYGNNAVRAVQVVHPVIRAATAADAPVVSAFARAAFHDTFAADNDPADMAAYLQEAFSPEKQASELAAKDRRCLLALVDGALVGYVSLMRGAPNDCVLGGKSVEIERFYVERHWHGRELGSLLMAAAVHEARAWGADVLWLGVWARNAKAIRFYEKQGFETVGAQTFRLGSDLQQDCVMRLPLGACVDQPSGVTA